MNERTFVDILLAFSWYLSTYRRGIQRTGRMSSSRYKNTMEKRRHRSQKYIRDGRAMKGPNRYKVIMEDEDRVSYVEEKTRLFIATYIVVRFKIPLLQSPESNTTWRRK